MSKLRELFQQADFDVIYMVRDDFYMLVPRTKYERDKYGTAVICRDAWRRLNAVLSESGKPEVKK